MTACVPSSPAPATRIVQGWTGTGRMLLSVATCADERHRARATSTVRGAGLDPTTVAPTVPTSCGHTDDWRGTPGSVMAPERATRPATPRTAPVPGPRPSRPATAPHTATQRPAPVGLDVALVPVLALPMRAADLDPTAPARVRPTRQGAQS